MPPTRKPVHSGKKSSNQAARRVTLLYALAGALWILLSDQALELLLRDPQRIVQVSMYKGWTFVTVTSLLLYALVRSTFSRLSEREAASRALLDNLPQLIWQKDQDSVFVNSNAAHARALGTTPEDLVGKSDRDFYPAELAAKYRADDCRIMEQGRVEIFDESWLRDGQERIVHTTKVPLRDEDGNPIGTLGIAEDITERKRIEEENRHLSEALRQSAAAILMATPQGHIHYGNPAFCRLFGYEESELPGLSVTDLCPPDPASRAEQQEIIKQLHAQDHWKGELLRRGRAGTPLPVYASIGAVRDPDGTITGFVGSYLDLTSLKSKEAALVQERDRSQRYLDTIQTIVVALDRDGRVTMINRAGCDLLGYSVEELVGRHWFATCLPQPEGMEQVFPVFQQIMNSELAKAEHFENQVLCRDGRRLLIAWHNTYLPDATGAIIGTLSSGEDVTEQRRAEAELRQQYDALERFSRATMGRELDMIRLKQQVNALSIQVGQTPPYPLEFLNPLTGGGKEEEDS